MSPEVQRVGVVLHGEAGQERRSGGWKAESTATCQRTGKEEGTGATQAT